MFISLAAFLWAGVKVSIERHVWVAYVCFVFNARTQEKVEGHCLNLLGGSGRECQLLLTLAPCNMTGSPESCWGWAVDKRARQVIWRKEHDLRIWKELVYLLSTPATKFLSNSEHSELCLSPDLWMGGALYDTHATLCSFICSRGSP